MRGRLRAPRYRGQGMGPGGSGRGSARLAAGERRTAPGGSGAWAVREGSVGAECAQSSAEGPRFGRGLAAGAGMAACGQTGKRFAESGSNGELARQPGGKD